MLGGRFCWRWKAVVAVGLGLDQPAYQVNQGHFDAQEYPPECSRSVPLHAGEPDVPS